MDELDLQLMNDCMGAIADPNIVRIDTNYDSRVNLPDFGLFAADYGYSFDPNESDNNDPNCERSDFNGDHRVDLADLEVLAQNWLTPFLDDNSVCTLCNLHTGADPNDPNAPGGAGVIDQRDMDAFMADWGKRTYTPCYVSFRREPNPFMDPNQPIEPNQPMEPNNLSGEIMVYPDNILPSTVLMFAQVDGHPAGLTYLNFSEPASIAIPTDEYGNGWHTLTVGGYTSEDGCWMENVKVQFQNSLYFVSVPDTYEPNQPLYFSAFNSGDDVSVKVYADCGNLVWSQTYDGNSITGSIPAQITGQHEIDYVSLDKSDGTSITKIEDPTDLYLTFDNKALIILPALSIRLRDYRTIWAVQDAFKDRGIKYKRLRGKSANYDDIAWYAKTNPIKYR